MSFRSTQRNELSLEKPGTSQANLPGLNEESKGLDSPQEESSSFMELRPMKADSDLQMSECGCSEDWSTVNFYSEAQAEKLQAWSGQHRDNTLKRTFLSEKRFPSTWKPDPSSVKKLVIKEKIEEPSRPLWPNKVEYILAQVGYSAGSISFWNFPNLWIQNGGINACGQNSAPCPPQPLKLDRGVFLLSYVLMLFSIGVPLMFMEMTCGQRLQKGILSVWKLTSPWTTGLGYTSFVVSILVSLFFNVANCWSLLYFSQSFWFPIPWEKCPFMKNSSAFDAECARTTPTMYFWYRKTLKISDTIGDGGPIIPGITVSLFLIWCLTSVIMINGIKSVGKVSVVDSIIILLESGTHLLSSLGLGIGIFSTFSSHMPPSNNCLIDAFVVALANVSISMLTTLMFVSIMGFWASIIAQRCSVKNVNIIMDLVYSNKLPPDVQPPGNILANPGALYTNWLESLPPDFKSMILRKVSSCKIQDHILQGGSGFAYLAFVEALSFIPGSGFWFVLFFLMHLCLGMTSVVGVLQNILTLLQDTFSLFEKHPRLLIGFYYMKLLGDYCLVLPILLLIAMEAIAIAWIYGFKRFLEKMVILTSHPVPPIFCVLLGSLCPFILIVLVLLALIYMELQKFTYTAWDSSTSREVLREYPSWVINAMISLIVIIFLPNVINCVHGFGSRSSSTFIKPIVVSTSLTQRDQERPNEVTKETVKRC
ncbi:PREDICTED: orphan sodium- and chloride-dependent neurotransmitter transporter NTT5-like [Elephantulus edwardii]|uniref:orphan sodium- and chloride-dependent neurotransmitter transporter NTT5-like n=1 Tax=Elephantulus edwardii TaxID=28737 RepID=UPI0003F0872A|nr:PREDICTED: orphan sodium- and chloride-dependent neurotransmitter transporter NTT5-like [Elephantulus edwardii]